MIPLAQDCARHLNAELEAVDLASFLANTPAYLAKTRHVVTLLESFDLGPLLQCAHEHDAIVGLLPVHTKSKVCRLFGIPPTMEDAMPVALQSGSGVKLDLLLCNDEVVSWLVTLGDVPFIELRQIADQQGLLWQHIKAVPDSLRALFGLQPKAITFTTAKDTKMKTAIIGAIVIENDIESLTSHFANQKTAPQDGNLSVVLVAPSSIMDYLSFLATALSPLPHVSKAIGFIKTKQMTLESDVKIDYHLDGQPRSAHQFAFRILPQAVTVNVGQGFAAARQLSKDDKAIMKIQTLPQGEERLQRLKQSLPLFSTAQDEDFKDTFAMLRDYARLSVPFSLLMALSAMLATLGLFLNSTPVVIGAMVLAPLMGPLVSLAMAILRNNGKLLKNSLQVFTIGTVLTLLVSFYRAAVTLRTGHG